MTVAELIALLLKERPDAPVMSYDGEYFSPDPDVFVYREAEAIVISLFAPGCKGDVVIAAPSWFRGAEDRTM